MKDSESKLADVNSAAAVAGDNETTDPSLRNIKQIKKNENNEHVDECESLSEASDVAVADPLDPLSNVDVLHGSKIIESTASLGLDDDDINAAPMHLHALRIPARLRGSAAAAESKLGGGGGRRSRSTSRSRRTGGRRSNNSSRSASPSTMRGNEGQDSNNASFASPIPLLHTTDAGSYSGGYTSAHSSLDGLMDPDIFLDRMGFIDLDPPLPHEIRLGPLAAPNGTNTTLTPVNERLSDETLEDCHAFQDLVVGSGSSMPSITHSSLSYGGSSAGSVGSGKGGGRQSREGSVTGGSVFEGDASLILETLDEEDEEEQGLDD